MAGFAFGPFLLDPDERRLTRGGEPVELSGRYLDALLLLVRENDRLISKDRFLDEVWHGVPVTEEALTQCIRALRKALGDDAQSPRFIETVPRHGYRFIAEVAERGALGRAGLRIAPAEWARALRIVIAGTVGGGVAGLVGGLVYGFAAAGAPEAGAGAISLLLVVLAVTLAMALIGAAGVSIGIAAARLLAGADSAMAIVGGALGGLAVGALVRLLGLDAFSLLFGRAPADITGGMEGALLGAAVGFGSWLAARARLSIRRGMAVGALAGGAAGMLATSLDGRLMAGSLDMLARGFPDSRLSLDALGGLFGEVAFGPAGRMTTATAEGMLFAACITAAIMLALRPIDTGAGRRFLKEMQA